MTLSNVTNTSNANEIAQTFLTSINAELAPRGWRAELTRVTTTSSGARRRRRLLAAGAVVIDLVMRSLGGSTSGSAQTDLQAAASAPSTVSSLQSVAGPGVSVSVQQAASQDTGSKGRSYNRTALIASVTIIFGLVLMGIGIYQYLKATRNYRAARAAFTPKKKVSAARVESVNMNPTFSPSFSPTHRILSTSEPDDMQV